MADVTYTGPIYLTGDMLAALSGEPTYVGEPGDPDYAIEMPDATALGTQDTLYRLVWTGLKDDTAVEFSSHQFWQLQVYDPTKDSDGDPTTGSSGWNPVNGYNHLTAASNLGSGDDYLVFEGNKGDLLLDLNGGLSTTPTTLTYYQYDQNGDPNVGDNDAQLDFSDAYGATNVICFCAGTLIETEHGPRPIETLVPGDMILTLDHGLQPLRWIGRNQLAPTALRIAPNLRPIRIAAGALGRDLPAQDLRVSPQHRILMRSNIAERISGAREVLIAAKHLVGLPGISVDETPAAVEYLHLLFDGHEVVFANGAEAESLYTGPQALRSLSHEARAELFTLFPELSRNEVPPPAARPLTNGKIGRKLTERHLKNGKPIVMAS